MYYSLFKVLLALIWKSMQFATHASTNITSSTQMLFLTPSITTPLIKSVWILILYILQLMVLEWCFREQSFPTASKFSLSPKTAHTTLTSIKLAVLWRLQSSQKVAKRAATLQALKSLIKFEKVVWRVIYYNHGCLHKKIIMFLIQEWFTKLMNIVACNLNQRGK